VGALDLPSEPREDGPIEQGGPAPESRELPGLEERDRVYEETRAYIEAGAAERAEPSEPPDAREQGGYWDQVPQFLEKWAEHERRWPREQHALEDSDVPEATPRSDSGSDRDKELRAETAEAVDRIREAEPGISADMRTTERENTYGGWLEGFDCRRKGEDRLKEKVTEQAEAEPDKSSAEILRKIPDAIRYTVCFQPDAYTRGYYDIKERMEHLGHEMYESKNSWGAAEYKGINTRWATAGGQRFEVQFHTPDSFHAKHHVTHTAYERIRDPATSKAESRELRAFQREVCSWLGIPDGAVQIPDYKKKGF